MDTRHPIAALQEKIVDLLAEEFKGRPVVEIIPTVLGSLMSLSVKFCLLGNVTRERFMKAAENTYVLESMKGTPNEREH